MLSKKLPRYFVLGCVLAVGACQTNQQTGELIGGGTGAAIGGFIGSRFGGTAGTVIGSAVGGIAGGLIGGGIGQNLDSEERARAQAATLQALNQPLYPSQILINWPVFTAGLRSSIRSGIFGYIGGDR
jgi:surface antigen